MALYIDKIHTIKMGFDKIKRNLKINTADIVEYCINKVLDKNCNIYIHFVTKLPKPFETNSSPTSRTTPLTFPYREGGNHRLTEGFPVLFITKDEQCSPLQVNSNYYLLFIIYYLLSITYYLLPK